MTGRTERSQLTPAEVVRRAYGAANRRRFAEADRWTVPEMARSVRQSTSDIRDGAAEVGKQARALPGGALRESLLELAAQLARLGPARDPHSCWRSITRRGSISSLEIIRQTIRGNRATVSLRLRLTSGEVVREVERLVRTNAGWLIGERPSGRRRTTGWS